MRCCGPWACTARNTKFSHANCQSVPFPPSLATQDAAPMAPQIGLASTTPSETIYGWCKITCSYIFRLIPRDPSTSWEGTANPLAIIAMENHLCSIGRKLQCYRILAGNPSCWNIQTTVEPKSLWHSMSYDHWNRNHGMDDEKIPN